MEQTYAIAAAWLALAVLSTVLASHLRISMALVEICVGMVAALVADHFFYPNALGANLDWLRFIASIGAVLLTFLAGAELDPTVMKAKRREVAIVGMFGFFAPFLGCAALARFVLGWNGPASWLAGIALSTTSMAVVYAVMLEFGFNKTEFGKGILGACFVNDLGTVIALGLMFAPFTYRTAVFVGVSVVLIALLPWITSQLTARYGNRTAAIRTKWILLVLCGMGALALWSGNEAVLPAYIAGMVLAKTIGRDNFYVRRLRTLTIGFLTPFYFLRAGSLVSLPALASAPLVFLALFSAKTASKIFGLFPVVGMFRANGKERWYYTLLMSTGLTFGTISALYGLTHNIVTKEQYSFLVAAVIASAVIPTLIANAVFLPRHLLPSVPMMHEEIPQLETISAGGRLRQWAWGRVNPANGLLEPHDHVAVQQQLVRASVVAIGKEVGRAGPVPANLRADGDVRVRRPVQAGGKLEVVAGSPGARHARAVLVAEPLEAHARLPAFVDLAVEILVRRRTNWRSCRRRPPRARWRSRTESRTASSSPSFCSITRLYSVRIFVLGSSCSRPALTFSAMLVRLLQLSHLIPPVNARSLLLSSQLSHPRVMPAVIVKSPSGSRR